MNTKRHKQTNAKTKKSRPTQRQLQVYCREPANTFNQFENSFNKIESGNFERELVKMFKTPFTPSKYTPKNDYYTYINYRWIAEKSEEIKKEEKYYVQVDSFRIGQEKVYYELIDIVKDYIKNNDTSRSRAVKNVYNSLLNLDDAATESYVGWAINRIDQIFASNSVYRMLAEINQNEIIAWGSPIVWSVMPDDKNSKIYRSYISAPQLTAYDYTIYIEDTKEDQEAKKYKKLFKYKYLKFIEDMFDACLGANHGLKASDVWDVEYDILGALGCYKIKRMMKMDITPLLKPNLLKNAA